MGNRAPIGIVIVAVLLVGGVLAWFAFPGRPLDPTLPEIGPGAKRVAGSARIGAPADGGAQSK